MTGQQVIIIIGPPGSGKGTQADLISENFGFYHFETSKMIEEKIRNGDQDDPIIAREKHLWESGGLNTPDLVTKWFLDKIMELSKNGYSLVMSGSPRTIFEGEAEIPLFENLYGKNNIKIIHINLSKEESIKRNSSRRICKANRHSIPNLPEYFDLQACPKDGSELETRKLDNPETIALRYQVYLERTQPLLSLFHEKGYKVIEIEGEQSIDMVYSDIIDALGFND